jgi:hypothetical protein
MSAALETRHEIGVGGGGGAAGGGRASGRGGGDGQRFGGDYETLIVGIVLHFASKGVPLSGDDAMGDDCDVRTTRRTTRWTTRTQS